MIVTQSSAAEDFSAVATAEFHVVKPDGTEATWSATIVAQSVTQITLRHFYANGDVAIPGRYVALASMDSGSIRSEPVEFYAYGKYEVIP